MGLRSLRGDLTGRTKYPYLRRNSGRKCDQDVLFLERVVLDGSKAVVVTYGQQPLFPSARVGASRVLVVDGKPGDTPSASEFIIWNVRWLHGGRRVANTGVHLWINGAD